MTDNITPAPKSQTIEESLFGNRRLRKRRPKRWCKSLELKQDIHSVCSHEAGHAVVCLACGVTVTKARVKRYTNKEGGTVIAGTVFHETGHPFYNAAIAAAGFIAQRKLGFDDASFSSSDYECIRRSASQSSVSPRKFFRQIWRQARWSLLMWDGALKDLASELYRVGKMDGDEVGSIVFKGVAA